MLELKKEALQHFMEKKSSIEVIDSEDEFEDYLKKMDISADDKRNLSNLRATYGCLCKEFAFSQGFDSAFNIAKQIYKHMGEDTL